MKVLLLDIDGVLNAHKQFENGYCGLDVEKVYSLDRIVQKTGCRIVLASAWRYMILEGDMTLRGFSHMLSIRGAAYPTCTALHGTLPRDRDPKDLHDRGNLAREWLTSQAESLRAHVTGPWTLSAVALDDGTNGHPTHPDGTDLGYGANGIKVVQPDGKVGLTYSLARLVIELLNSSISRIAEGGGR